MNAEDMMTIRKSQQTSLTLPYLTPAIASLMLLIATVLPLMAIATESSAALPQHEIATKKERGRYWYEKPAPKVKEKEAEKTQRSDPQAPTQTQFKRPILPAMATLMKMHPQQIQALYSEVKDYHTMKPTIDTATDLLIIDNVITKKSRAAAAVKQLAMLKNPALSGQFENPVAPSIKNLTNQQQTAIVTNRLLTQRNEFAYLVFTQPSCAACGVYRNTLALFQDKFGWTYKEYNIHKNIDLVNRFGIYGTPTTILIQRGTKNWFPIAQGAIPYTTLIKNTSQGVRLLRNEITPDQWFTSDVQTNSYFDPAYTPIKTPADNSHVAPQEQ